MAELSRRRALAGALLGAAWAAGCSSPPRVSAEPVSPIQARIAALEQRNDRRIGLFAADLESGRTVEYRADDMLAMCSTFKAYAGAAVLQRVRRGESSLSDTVTVDPAELIANSPVTATRAGQLITLEELCAAALQHSDNTAANMILKTIGGPSAVTAFARGIGDEVTRLDRWELELNTALPNDPRDTSTPRALGLGFETLLTGNALGADRRTLENWMRANVTSSMRAGLPAGWTSADKTGSGDYGSTNDVGIAYGSEGQRLLISIMTRSDKDPKAENNRQLIGDVTAMLVQTLT
jgi:beta-lactamase class A